MQHAGRILKQAHLSGTSSSVVSNNEAFDLQNSIIYKDPSTNYFDPISKLTSEKMTY